MILSGDIDNGDAEWLMTGGISGSMPDIKLTESLESKFDSMYSTRLQIGVRGYGAQKSLSEWRKFAAEKSRMEDGVSIPNYETNYMRLSFDLD